MLTALDIRKTFIAYFEANGHRHEPSASLIPKGDKTLLFTNAGMVPFKQRFLGQEAAPHPRAVSIQRCVRAGGKHNDLDNVGYTARHHTFFEMMGNFSFGDYFKPRAIELAWQFLTVELGLPKEKLWVSVYEEDEESAAIWRDTIGVDAARISYCGEKDNFWSMGNTGPCGPCTEIFYDHGAHIFGGPPGSKDEDGDRYVEVWNLVFMQYNRLEDGTLVPLPKPSVDTGMGLERIAAVMQGVTNNYDTDEFVKLAAALRPMLADTAHIEKPSAKVICDHIRACAFMIADGVVPANEGRGYVLRRIIRRAVRHGHSLGVKETPFFHRLVAPLTECMGEVYPELVEKGGQIEAALKNEEAQFQQTLEAGLRVLRKHMEASVKHDGEQGAKNAEKSAEIAGDVAFMLYDTYGFPLDLTQDIAREEGLRVDTAGFDSAMAAQQARGRANQKFAARLPFVDGHADIGKFVGYDLRNADTRTKVALMFDEAGQACDRLDAGASGFVVLNACLFYGESGGQVGDIGALCADDARFVVEDTQKQGDTHMLLGRMAVGTLRKGATVAQIISDTHRKATSANHSATHLLHAALTAHIGAEVTQRGSLVAADKLRFDFSATGKIANDTLAAIEREVNEKIAENIPVTTQTMPLPDAEALGAKAFFEEKYPDIVRVVSIGENSVELCGGAHVATTTDIGGFHIVSEGAVAAGVRRIEAITGSTAFAHLKARDGQLQAVAARLGVAPEKAADKVANLEAECQNLRAALAEYAEQARRTLANAVIANDENAARGYAIVDMGEADSKAVRSLADSIVAARPNWRVVLSARQSGKAYVACRLGADVVKDVATDKNNNATVLVNQIAGALGGKGGGKPNFAMAGIPTERIAEVADIAQKILDARAQS